MDEKESVVDKPVDSVSESPEGGSGDDNPQSDKPIETVTSAVNAVNSESESTEVVSELGNQESEPQNHVDHDLSSATDAENVNDSENAYDNESMEVDVQEKEAEDQPEKEPTPTTSEPSIEDKNDDIEKVKDELSDDNSQVASQDASQEETDNPDNEDQSNNVDSASQASQVDEIKNDTNDDEGKDEFSEKRHDEVGKPEFETAPNVSLDDTQEEQDHSQALDPFDVLLKDLNDTNTASTETPTTSNAETINAVDDDDDDHMVDNVEAGDGDDEEAQTDNTQEITEEPGADEEVCLLPDTEREISEADKAEAEKVLAEKRRQAEAEAEAIAVPKEENEAMETDSGRVESEGVHNDSTEDIDTSANAEDASQENGGDKENDTESEESTVFNIIQEIKPTVTSNCIQCKQLLKCRYKYITKEGESNFLCNDTCITPFLNERPGQYFTLKKYIIDEIVPRLLTCSECEEEKACFFYYRFDGEDTYYCSLQCLHGMMADEKDKYTFNRRKIIVDQLEPKQAECSVCNQEKPCIFTFIKYGKSCIVCSNACIKTLNANENGRYVIKRPRTPRFKVPTPAIQPLKLKVISNATDKYIDGAYKSNPAIIQAARDERQRTFQRRCTQCTAILNIDENRYLSWETMDYCDELCLGRYQNKYGSHCANCQKPVRNTSLGKYCVRFGYDIRQFCNSGCLEEFKKGLKICCYCQRDISVGHQGFLAPVGDKGQFKDFCSQNCMAKFDQMSKNPIPQPVWAKCAVCSIDKETTIEVEISEDSSQRLCSDPCFAAFKFVNNILPDQCRWCKKYFERKKSNCYTIYEETTPNCFCSKSCMNVYISNSRHILPCNWCKVKKYNFDMIRRPQSKGRALMMCSLNCLNLYQVSINAVSSRRTKCDMCKRTSLAQYHLTMSDATVRNFCTYQCVMTFQGQYSKHAAPLMPGEPPQQKAVPTGAPRRTYSNNAKSSNTAGKTQPRTTMPVISNVQSLAAPPPLTPAGTRSKSKRISQQVQAEPEPEPEPPAAPKTPPPPPKPPTPPPPPPPKIYNHVIVKTLPPKEVANKATMSKPQMVSKGVSCRPHPCTKECQTDPSLERRVLIPVPVPIYVPVPCAMWSLPFPVPIPIPLPIPTPVFIPTTRNSAKGIMKEINKIHDKMPTDPFEAELLMMAEMVAGDKKKDQSDSDTDDDNADETFSPVAGMDGNNAFGEDMLQMALKMATEYEDQPVDLESAMTANTITPSSHPGMPGLEGDSMHHHHMMVLEQQRAVAALRAGVGAGAGAGAARKRPPAPPPPRPSRSSKRRRADPAPPPPPEPPREPAEKPDANMCLKYTFGVNAWKQWVMTKNAEIEKSSMRRKLFKSEILQLTSDELNYSLCMFVKEVRKPNNSEYAPDTIYYLVLGIQQYLFENGRIDNIFTDPYYEKFTDCLDEVARKFSVLYNDSQYIVTRVEEEHLWESKQLGAHSPHVLLSTLMFFNTKHFNLVTVEEHMQLSFSHIMKHWKRNPNQPGQTKIPGSRNVLLRFYPPQSALEANSRKKKVYEQQENEENPLRCPVKLYEFYISKCPESVRTRNDVFYLQPERSCVPDSPVWYSTQPLSRAALAKMLHRVKMVKEINIALLTS